jgi:plasmid maintenance system antidote protein VapI
MKPCELQDFQSPEGLEPNCEGFCRFTGEPKRWEAVRPVHQQQEQAVRDVLDECFQPSPPGDTIKDIMEEKDISRSKLGKLLDIRDEQVSKLLSGIYLIDSDMAYRLSVALGSTQDFWEERERQYRIQLREELRQSAKEPVQEGRAPGDER